MPKNRNITLILIITLITSTTLTTITSLNTYAQQEMTPAQTFEAQDENIKLAFSADGKYIAAMSNETDTLSLFNHTGTLWTTTVPGIHSIAISENASPIAAGADSGIYLFNTQTPTPHTHYNLNFESPTIALSDNGNTLAYAATTTNTNSETVTALYLFETQNQDPTWHTTLQGSLKSLSISGNGSRLTISTNHPAALHLLSTQQPTPLWTHDFQEQSGAAKLSQNGDYIITTAGNQTSQDPTRIHRFQQQSPLPNYSKLISEQPPAQQIAVSANGQIFAISLPTSNRLVFFNLDLPPYGYGPGSVLNISLPSRPVSLSISLDGKHTVVGTTTGIYLYQYQNSQLTLKKQYTTNKPSIIDIAISSNGSYIVAAAKTQQNQKYTAIYLFNLEETRDSFSDILLPIALVAIAVIVAATTTALPLRRKHKPQKPKTQT